MIHLYMTYIWRKNILDLHFYLQCCCNCYFIAIIQWAQNTFFILIFCAYLVKLVYKVYKIWYINFSIFTELFTLIGLRKCFFDIADYIFLPQTRLHHINDCVSVEIYIQISLHNFRFTVTWREKYFGPIFFVALGLVPK